MKLFESLRGEGKTCIEWSGLAGHYQLRPYINLQLIAIQFWLWRHHLTRSPPVTLPASDGVVEVTCSRRGRGAPVCPLTSRLVGSRVETEPDQPTLERLTVSTWHWPSRGDTNITLHNHQVNVSLHSYWFHCEIWRQTGEMTRPVWLTLQPQMMIRWLSIILRGPAQSDVTVWFALKGRLLSYPEDPLPSEHTSMVIVLGVTNNCHYNYGVIQRTLIASWWSSVHFEREMRGHRRQRRGNCSPPSHC